MEKKLLDSARWIWRAEPAGDDEFAGFYADFTLDHPAALTLEIAADSNYAVWLDGAPAAFGQYADYPDYKVYDRVALSAGAGAHRLAVRAWYYGIDTQTYRRGEAGVIFALAEGDRLLAVSSAATPARLDPSHLSHRGELISPQLGPTFHVDAEREDGWMLPGGEIRFPFGPAREAEGISRELHPRPVEKLTLGERCPSRLIQHGSFVYADPNARSAERMQSAALSWRPIEALSGQHDRSVRPLTFRSEEGDGIYLIFDLGREEAGFVDFDLEVPAACDMEIGYGEHLRDGRCLTAVRNFSADYRLRAGRSSYLHMFRRFGARYLQCFVHTKELTLHYFGLRPTDYPVNVLPFDAGSLLRRRIYDVCLRTLLLCMHEHYEDCPWREQALYTMDSRNQMLCGYYTFGETKFPRACLELMTHGVGETGLLNLCFPAGRDHPIPFFSLMYFIQMREYMDYSGDDSLVRTYYGLLRSILSIFLDRRDETGLTPNFTKKPFWNFYEWQPTLHGSLGSQGDFPSSHDAPLNGFLSLALEAMSAMAEKTGHAEDAANYAAIRAEINNAIRERFYNPSVKLFESFDNRDHGAFSVLTNSLCLLCGAADGLDTAAIERLLVGNGRHMAAALGAELVSGPLGEKNYENCGRLVIPNTLSMNCFRFDALLRVSRAKYAPVILDEIDQVYFGMLREGATTFWETIEGEADFSDAGSLCHGWSALPAYYYHILGDAR